MITVFGLVLAWIHLPNERIIWLKIVAVLLGICGVAVIFTSRRKECENDYPAELGGAKRLAHWEGQEPTGSNTD